ncbi:MAG: signal recognition particle-docking protein FtsY [Desulfovibrionaceae bacterium]|nr:signal recognition particle-docking protein FtsY [Desulfovibrionaceae bacterium]MBO4794055.1 signal recognition particle-docking protein FtsY [Deltaproteobacteria bacterium]
MGFFSSVKKFFSSDQQPAAQNESGSGASSFSSEELTVRLREAEPKLSVWLDIVLEGISQTGNALWERLRFLLTALGASEDEAQKFTDDLSLWTQGMGYEDLEDFRSELQYRLALALDLEDEEDEKNRLFLKLQAGLARTRAQFGQGLKILFAEHGELTPEFWDELLELFIMADMGMEAAETLCGRLKKRAVDAGATTPAELHPLLAEEVAEIFRIPRRVVAVNPPEIVLIIGVNGVGKTTTIAKLAYRARSQGKKVMLAAADTFRAAAVEQLGIWAERTGSLFHSKGQDADPSAVAWEAVDRAVAEGVDVLFVDTAGRLHTKTNLMEELKKIRSVLGKKHPGAPHRSVLILDATTGQNALSQVKLFKEAAGIDEIILTKLDGTAKGGVAVAIAMQYKIPITFVGLGEKMEDLRPFDGDDYARALLE